MSLTSLGGKCIEIDALNLQTYELNTLIKKAVKDGAEKVVLKNVYGQRYIGTRLCLERPIKIEIHGTPGNDLGAFNTGHQIIVYGNAQDGVGNTMDGGEIIIHGRAGDVLALSMRGGEIFVRDGVGYRAGVHMKEYLEKKPVVVIGGTAQDFLGEYMAGGVLILLGLDERPANDMDFVGVGMHGGVMYIRAKLERRRISNHVEVLEPSDQDYRLLELYVEKFSRYFGIPKDEILGKGAFMKLIPASKRPYSTLYK
ncbi:MAG: hypothetical protein QW815_03785 [Nitrososphaerota archaeon]